MKPSWEGAQRSRGEDESGVDQGVVEQPALGEGSVVLDEACGGGKEAKEEQWEG